MIKSCDLLVLTLVYLAHHIVVSALGHRDAPLALAAFNFDQSSRPSSDGKRQLREKDIVRDARDEERGVSSFVSRISFWKKGPIKDKKLEKFLHEKWLRKQRPSDHKRPVQDLDVLRFLEKHDVDHDQLKRQFDAQGRSYTFDRVTLDEAMIEKYKRFRERYPSGYLNMDELLKKKKFNPHDENHRILFFQEYADNKAELSLELLLEKYGYKKTEIDGLLELYKPYRHTISGLKSVNNREAYRRHIAQDDIFRMMTEYQITPDGLNKLFKLDKSYSVHGNMITPAFVDEYTKYVKNLAEKRAKVEGQP
ncbi:hypothetical protein PsorP6_005709 [Peronosclerospora sorghi]|uniref:Uncharacterized protein n=1 Tax=Peronosclerospora sorghi TaxID=230839 RepID=A0ACC0W641_9STRA|nr:hypothetical protein PsorP6_005709 [Peronosclerospora sorghi]